MKKAEIKVGMDYVAKVSNVLTVVRIERALTSGWEATNIKTGRAVHIRSAAKLRREAKVQAQPSTPAPSAPVPDAARRPVPRNRCKCGKPMSKWASMCKSCDHAHLIELRTAALKVVESGVCPTCGAPLRRNSSLDGWYQCAQFGAPQFRVDPFAPGCSYQITVPRLDR